MEKDNSLVFLNFQKITNAITSGNPEDHENNENIETNTELTNENDQIDEDDDIAGIFLSPLVKSIETQNTFSRVLFKLIPSGA